MRSRAAVAVTLLALSALGATCKQNGAGPAKEAAKETRAQDAAADPPEAENRPPAEIEGLDLSQIRPEQRSDAVRILNETFCYCGCPRTLAACLANKKDCSCVRCTEKMTGFILDLFRAGSPTDDVEYQVLEGFTEGYNGAVQTFDLANHPAKGSDNPKHTLVEFADFRCAHCREAFPILEQVVAQNPDVRLVYFYFPLGGAESPSVLVAEAAEEARAQGKFWEMAAVLFKNQHALEKDQLLAYAKEIGLDAEKMRTALEKGTHRARVLADRQVGDRVKVQSTPTIFVDGRPFGLARTVENFKLRFEMERERGRCE